MNALTAEWLVGAWHHQVEPAFRAGRLTNELTLLAELYHSLEDPAEPELHTWLRPRLSFPPTKGPIFDQLDTFQLKKSLQDQAPGLILTQQETVIAVVEVCFLPQDYVDYRPNLRMLSALHQLKGREQLHLGWGAQQQPYWLREDLLLAYALITRKGALALQARTLRQEMPAATFPQPLLQLIGAVEGEKAVFTYQWLE